MESHIDNFNEFKMVKKLHNDKTKKIPLTDKTIKNLIIIYEKTWHNGIMA
jgi:hypothetical protein